ncbi:4e7d66d9-0422-4270-ac91-91cf43ec624e [Thermothielavioides terrestris]|uniref:4e7d66d9-0422-4270-ac91-91cf43ec624e n=1 Tax=Thermothielavioides terrestris TaxID=2587410 RepID=A0A3S4BEL3_9PEZI|nr:4e7d66d9-0422-4270-ac91-91cf43ec624e [Thermothielavioides terrestris]
MALQESANVSSSSLGLSGAETPLPNSLSPPPPRDAERYEKRILPQVPRKRESGVSNFSKEVDEALATPDSVITPDEDHEKDDNQKREDLKLDIANLPTSVPGGVLSPKVAKVLGVLGPRESTPSGHKSPAKVRRLTGFELACEGSSQLNKRHRAKEHTQLHGEVSPVSNESSPYDHEEPKTAVSDLDAGPEADGWTYSPSRARAIMAPEMLISTAQSHLSSRNLCASRSRQDPAGVQREKS